MKNQSLNPYELPFLKFGKGEKTILAFHGFGQNSSFYKTYGDYFGNEYTIYAFFLPYHGDYQWRTTEAPISPSRLTNYLDLILQKFNINKFVLIGYSIGAKIALTLTTHYHSRLNKLVLIAPDGITGNFWYRFATSNFLSRRIFKFGVRNQHMLISVAELLSKVKLVHRANLRFAKSQLGDDKQIDKVYFTWLALRDMNAAWRKVKTILKSDKIQTIIILGERDKIISPARLKPYITDIPEIDTYILNAGHTNLIEEGGKYLKEKNLL